LPPKDLLMTPVEAVRRVLTKAGWRAEDVDLFELNEAFSVQAVAVLRELSIDPERVNVNGGAVALGHPIGASGARILTTLLYGLVVLFFIPETRPIATGTAPTAAASPARESPWRDGVFLQVALVGFLSSMVFFSDLTVLPLTITVSAAYPAAVYGALVGLNGLLIALFEMSAVGPLSRYRRLRVAALGTILTGLGFGVTGFWLHWSWFLLVILLSTAGEILTSPQQMAFVADWAPPRTRGRYLSLYQATWSLSLAVNPVVLLPLHAHLSEAVFWSLMGLVAIPAALLLLRLDRIADHPKYLRGLSHAPATDPTLRDSVLAAASAAARGESPRFDA